MWMSLLLAVPCLTLEDPPSIDDLISIMRNREAAITAVSVRMTVLFGIRDSLPDRSLAPMAFQNDLYEIIEESLGRTRVEKVTQMPDLRGGESGVADVVQLYCYDGQSTRVLTSTLERPIRGEVLEGRQIPMPFWGSLFTVMTKFSTTPLPRFLEKHRANVTKYRVVSTPSGREILELEVTAPEVDRLDKMNIDRLELDPEAGFAPLKVELWDKQGSGEPYLRFAYEMTKHLELMPGIWVPGRVRYLGYGIVDGKTKRGVERDIDAIFDDWQLNPPIDKSTFRVSFPKGVQIRDEVQRTSYIAKEVDDDVVANQVVQAKRLLELRKSALPDGKPESGSSLWVGIGVLSIVVVIALAVVLIRARSTPTGPATTR